MEKDTFLTNSSTAAGHSLSIASSASSSGGIAATADASSYSLGTSNSTDDAFFIICDGAVQLSTDSIGVFQTIREGQTVGETALLRSLDYQKRVSRSSSVSEQRDPIHCKVIESGVAMRLSHVGFRSFFKSVLSDPSKRIINSFKKSRTSVNLRSSYPVFNIFPEKALGYLCDVCTTRMYLPRESIVEFGDQPIMTQDLRHNNDNVIINTDENLALSSSSISSSTIPPDLEEMKSHLMCILKGTVSLIDEEGVLKAKKMSHDFIFPGGVMRDLEEVREELRKMEHNLNRERRLKRLGSNAKSTEHLQSKEEEVAAINNTTMLTSATSLSNPDSGVTSPMTAPDDIDGGSLGSHGGDSDHSGPPKLSSSQSILGGVSNRAVIISREDELVLPTKSNVLVRRRTSSKEENRQSDSSDPFTGASAIRYSVDESDVGEDGGEDYVSTRSRGSSKLDIGSDATAYEYQDDIHSPPPPGTSSMSGLVGEKGNSNNNNPSLSTTRYLDTQEDESPFFLVGEAISSEATAVATGENSPNKGRSAFSTPKRLIKHSRSSRSESPAVRSHSRHRTLSNDLFNQTSPTTTTLAGNNGSISMRRASSSSRARSNSNNDVPSAASSMSPQKSVHIFPSTSSLSATFGLSANIQQSGETIGSITTATSVDSSVAAASQASVPGGTASATNANTSTTTTTTSTSTVTTGMAKRKVSDNRLLSSPKSFTRSISNMVSSTLKHSPSQATKKPVPPNTTRIRTLSFAKPVSSKLGVYRAICEEKTFILVFPHLLVSNFLLGDTVAQSDFEIRTLKRDCGFRNVLHHPVALQFFQQHLENQFALENLDFYLEAEAFTHACVNLQNASSPRISPSRDGVRTRGPRSMTNSYMEQQHQQQPLSNFPIMDPESSPQPMNDKESKISNNEVGAMNTIPKSRSLHSLASWFKNSRRISGNNPGSGTGNGSRGGGNTSYSAGSRDDQSQSRESSMGGELEEGFIRPPVMVDQRQISLGVGSGGSVSGIDDVLLLDAPLTSLNRQVSNQPAKIINHGSSIKALQAQARAIYTTYIAQSASRQINIESQTRSEIDQAMQLSDESELVRTCIRLYHHAQDQVYTIMKRDAFPRFRGSELFPRMLDEICEVDPKLKSKLPRLDSGSNLTNTGSPGGNRAKKSIPGVFYPRRSFKNLNPETQQQSFPSSPKI